MQDGFTNECQPAHVLKRQMPLRVRAPFDLQSGLQVHSLSHRLAAMTVKVAPQQEQHESAAEAKVADLRAAHEQQLLRSQSPMVEAQAELQQAQQEAARLQRDLSAAQEGGQTSEVSSIQLHANKHMYSCKLTCCQHPGQTSDTTGIWQS